MLFENKISNNANVSGRFGETVELKGLYLFLASDASTYGTGTDILVEFSKTLYTTTVSFVFLTDLTNIRSGIIAHCHKRGRPEEQGPGARVVDHIQITHHLSAAI